MFEHLTERHQEVAFSATLLLSVCLAFGVVEGSTRLYVDELRKTDVDWSSLIASAAQQQSTGSEFHTFKPNSQFGHLAFNDRGYRSPPLASPKPTNSVRIAFLGDSVIFGGEYTEDKTIPAITTRLLEKAHPHCKFEYITMAGPGYSMNFLAEQWAKNAPAIRSDVAVVLAGTTREMIREHDALADPKNDLMPATAAETPAARQWRSEFLALANRQIAIMSPIAAIGKQREINWQDMSSSFDRMSARLVQSLSGTPVFALGYRPLLRSSQPREQQSIASRNLRAAVSTLTVSQTAELSEFLVAQMKRMSKSAGWQFNDALSEVPGTREFYRDFTHLSEHGTAKVAERTASWIGTFITDSCEVRPTQG